MRFLLTLGCVLLTSGATLAAETSVHLQRQDDQIKVTIDGQPFAVYNFGDDLPKPFFSPVRGPHGKILTRPIERPGDDHPHHKGIWIAVDKVNGIAYWSEEGRIEAVQVKLPVPDGNPAQMKVRKRWLDKQGKPVLIETTTIRIGADRLLSYDIRFTPAGEKVVFDDTKEGFFAFRMVNSMREEETGHVVNADGLEGADACWGKPSAWIDYYGQVDGQTVGLAIFDHPLNFRPSRYHVRDYGLFAISPFGPSRYSKGKRPADPVILRPGENLRLRYAMYIHAGNTKNGRVAQAYRAWLKSAED